MPQELPIEEQTPEVQQNQNNPDVLTIEVFKKMIQVTTDQLPTQLSEEENIIQHDMI